MNRLRAARNTSVVVVTGPAGYGKSTLLALWAERDARDVAWLSVDEGDNDPKRFLAYLALALGRVRPLEIGVFEHLASPRSSAANVATHLGAAITSWQEDVLIVLDDAHLLEERAVIDVLGLVVAHLPAGSAVALGARARPALPLARLRAEGRLLEIGRDDLHLSEREAGSMLKAASLELSDDQAARLTEQTEGWAAGVYLGGLSMRARSTSAKTPFGGADRFVTDYFDLEVLDALSPSTVEFLVHTSVLERMCGSLCDAVLETSDSTQRLEELERANAFVIALDRERRWYRLHRLFRESLREELERRAPALVADLVARASAWCEAHGDVGGAIDYAAAARDTDRVADLVTASAACACVSGDAAAAAGWLARIDDERVLARHPSAALVGATVHALAGRHAQAERWLESAGRGRRRVILPDGSRPSAWRALAAAALGEDVDEMAGNARRALGGLAAGSVLTPMAHLLRGIAESLRGRYDDADPALVEAYDTALAVGAGQTACIALAQRSLIAGVEGSIEESERLALLARDAARAPGVADDPAVAIAFAASARSALRASDWSRARDDLARARSLAAKQVPGWLAAQLLVELADLYLALGDAAEAEALIHELDQRPERSSLGLLTRAARSLRQGIAERKGEAGRQTLLTAAELRLLPFLSTHLSFPEIADRLYVSRNTVKAQAISVYRKLGVSSRSDAVVRAVELGLMTVGAA